MKNLAFTCMLVAVCFTALCQQYNTVIEGSFKTDKFNSINLITSDILSSDFIYIGRAKIDSQKKFIFKLNLTRPVLCKLFENVFFITPHDSIEIEASENSKSRLGYDLTVINAKNSNNYTYYNTFISSVKAPSFKQFKDGDFSWLAFQKIYGEFYKAQLAYLDRSNNNNELSTEFYQFLKKNCLFEHMLALLDPLYYKMPFSTIELRNSLQSLGLDTLIKSESSHEFLSFKSFLKQYFKYVVSAELVHSDNNIQFINQFEYVRNNFEGASRELLISLIFKETVTLPDPKYYAINDSIYNYAKKNFLDSSMLSFIEGKYLLYKNLHNKVPVDILATKLKDVNGIELELGSILSTLKGHNILIDNWASWCAPCISAIKKAKMNINFLNKNNIIILYLSQDEEAAQWKKRHSSLKLPKQHSFLLNDPQKTFTKYFRISSIPHYILIDANGNLLSQNSPGLTDVNELIKLIETK